VVLAAPVHQRLPLAVPAPSTHFLCFDGVQLVRIKYDLFMKAYSIDLREKIVAAHIQEKISIRQVAIRFAVSKSLVQKLVKQQQFEGNLQPKQRGKPQFSHLTNAEVELREMVVGNPDATLVEFCELFALKTGNWVSRTAMCRALQKLGLNRKKKHCGVVKQQLQEFKN
jgi:transposase